MQYQQQQQKSAVNRKSRISALQFSKHKATLCYSMDSNQSSSLTLESPLNDSG